MTRPELFSGIINLAASQWPLPANCISKIALPTAESPPPRPCFLWDCHLSTRAIRCTTCQSSILCGVGDSRKGYSRHLMVAFLSSVSDSTENWIVLSTVCVWVTCIVPSTHGSFFPHYPHPTSLPQSPPVPSHWHPCSFH